jgi:hypothetical protein
MSQPNEPLDIVTEVKAVLGGLTEFLPEPPLGSIPPMPDEVRQAIRRMANQTWNEVNGPRRPELVFECKHLSTPLMKSVGEYGHYFIEETGAYCRQIEAEVEHAAKSNLLSGNLAFVGEVIHYQLPVQLQAVLYLPSDASERFPAYIYNERVCQGVNYALHLSDVAMTCNYIHITYTDRTPAHLEVSLWVKGSQV